METERTKEKKALREAMRQKRDSMMPEDIQNLSREIFQRLRAHIIYQEAPVIYSYASFRSEADTWDFNRHILSDGKILALPKVLGKENIEFYRITSMDQLVQGYMGIWEPGPECLLVKGLAGLILVPGLAFDSRLFRLGYGGGFYDRYLCGGDLISCGAAFEDQIIDRVPRESFDYPLDYIVTERQMLKRMDEK